MGRIWNFEQFGSAPALIDDCGNTVSYEDLLIMQKTVEGAGYERHLVMLLTDNTIGSISSFAAFLNAGFPVMLISCESLSEIRAELLKTYRPAILLLPTSMCRDYPFMKQEITIYDYTALLTNYDNPYPANDDLGLLLTTSGSTGSSKFVRQSFQNILINANTLAGITGMTSSERTITALPMHYTYGLSMINASLLTGATMIVTKKSFLEEEFWDFFEEQQVTALHCVSGTYDVLRRTEILEEGFPSLRLLTQAGSRLSADLHDYLAKYAESNGKTFLTMYGQCEATAAISYLPSDLNLEKEGSIGIPIKVGSMTLLDQQGTVIDKENENGEICYEGPNVAMGYSTCGEDLIRGDDWKGCLRSGDLAKRDADGFYYITGRIKRYIKMFGNRISLDEIDDRIMEALHIRSASVGEDDDLFIFVTGDEEKTAVTDFVIRNYPGIRTGIRVVIIEDFPKNEAGKIRYGELLDISRRMDH